MPPRTGASASSSPNKCRYDKAIDKMKKKDLEKLIYEMGNALYELPLAVRRAYTSALEIVPELVAAETPLLAFLRTDEYNPTAAALRLTNYWTYRQSLFGDLWLLPMTLTGRGAMTAQEIAFLQSGCFLTVPLPNGNRLFIVDHSKAFHVFEKAKQEAWDTGLVFERIAMYMGTAITSPQVQTAGATLMYPITRDKRPVLEFRSNLWEKVRTCYPFKFSNVIVAQAYEPAGYAPWLDFCRYQVAETVRFNSGLVPIEVQADSCAKTIQQIEKLGLDRSIIPISLGGSMVCDKQVASWMRAQISLEELRTPTLSSLTRPSNYVDASTTQVVLAASSSRTKPKRKRDAAFVRMTSHTPDEDGNNGSATANSALMIRQRNALYSRRMYHKRKLETLSLQQEIEWLQVQQQALQQEERRLVDLLGQAQACVDKDTKDPPLSSSSA